jgi:4-phospho-D-threonate 3-dehydrogenase / 4-phospho-D-erythronate 3-dehydrogenase
MPNILIIADDLTGAADCGAMFAERGFAATVLLAGPEEGAVKADDWRDGDVLAVDADTRGVGPDYAAACAARIVQEGCSGPAAEGKLIFKKVDSTLRGNVAAELAGALRAMREHVSPATRVAILFAPAFPAWGRTTVNGRQLVNGEPLETSDAWRRERMRPHNHIAAMLCEAGLSSALLEFACVRGGEGELHSGLLKSANEADVVICDAESDADLESIARAGMLLDMKTMWAGSAGLARQVAQSLGRTVPGGTERLRTPRVRGSALFVVGSPAAASREQARALASAPGVSVFTFSPSELLCAQPSADALVSGRLENGDDVLVQFDSSEACDARRGHEIARSLARMIAPCADQAGALVATGGETARAILDAWGIRRMRLVGEVEPGLPYSIAQRAGREILILTKAGGFGTRETLVRSRDFLRARGVAEIETFNMQKPIIAITMGDAAGVGPEVIVKSLAHREVYEQCRPLVIGDAERLRQADRICVMGLAIHTVPMAEIAEADYRHGTVNCVDLKLISSDLPWGKLSTQAGEAAYQYLTVASQLAMEGKVAAICTAPLNKEALHAAGHKFPGHTELLAHLTGTAEVSMMLTTPKLRVLHVTTHIGLIDAIAKIEPGLVERTIARGHAALAKSGIAEPRIGVCGINPHAGENGLFGRGEEEQKIIPAIIACRERGWNVEGPLPADTLFYRAQRGDFDLVIAMYHDQGHGPVKVLGLESGVNITIGLPVVRTSVDHGTAFDIAGTGKADERSLLEAICQAVELAPR